MNRENLKRNRIFQNFILILIFALVTACAFSMIKDQSVDASESVEQANALQLSIQEGEVQRGDHTLIPDTDLAVVWDEDDRLCFVRVNPPPDGERFRCHQLTGEEEVFSLHLLGHELRVKVKPQEWSHIKWVFHP